MTPGVRGRAVGAMLTRTQHVDQLLTAIELGVIHAAVLTAIFGGT